VQTRIPDQDIPVFKGGGSFERIFNLLKPIRYPDGCYLPGKCGDRFVGQGRRFECSGFGNESARTFRGAADWLRSGRTGGIQEIQESIASCGQILYEAGPIEALPERASCQNPISFISLLTLTVDMDSGRSESG